MNFDQVFALGMAVVASAALVLSIVIVYARAKEDDNDDA